MGKFLYQEIKDYLLGLIKEHKSEPHYQLPSENQLALKFATTRITAKRALTELQEEGYIYRVHGKGSFINPEIASNKELRTNDFICMLLPNLESRFIADMIAGTKQYLKEQGYHLLLLSEAQKDLSESKLISHIVELGVKGIIVFPNSRATYNKDLLLLALNKFPVVFVDRTLQDLDISSVTSDHTEIGRKGAQLLFDKGCKNIGFITMPPEYSSSIAQRINGYEKAHAENELYIKSHNVLLLRKNDPNQVNTICKYLKEHPDLQGLLSYGGKVGLNLYRALAMTGISVPEQLKIVFLDDEYEEFQDFLPFSPTCISQQAAEIGRQAAQLVVGYISKKSVTNDKVLLECDVIERESTGGKSV